MKKSQKNSGMALTLAILAAVILMITGGALLAVGYQSRAYQIHTASEIAARSAADSGMAQALDNVNTLYAAGLLDAQLPTEKNIPLVGSDADYSYTVTKDNGTYTITSTGNSNTATKTVQATLALAGPSYAVLVADSFYMKNNGVITGSCGTLSTALGAFDVKNGTITGDAFVGVGGDPANINSTVLGQTYALQQPITLADVSLPLAAKIAGPNSNWNIPGNYTLGNSGTTTYVRYSDVTINGTLNISGNVIMYIDGDLSDVGAGINVKENSSLELYITGDFGPGGNGVDLSSTSKDPSVLRIYGVGTSAQEFTLGKNKAKAIASIYAPKADVTIGKNTSNFTGQLIAKSFSCKNIVDIAFDPRAAEGGSNPLLEMKVRNWHE